MKIPLAAADRQRRVANEPDVRMRNRFIEKNPVLSDASPSFIARPALHFWQDISPGPIRAVFQQPGAFNDDMFVVSFNSLYRIDRLTGVPALITNLLSGGEEDTPVKMCCTGDVGAIGPRLWVADGHVLLVYMEDGFAKGTFTATAIVDGDVVRVGSTYYRFSTGTLDAGAPAGTVGNPWRVLIGASIIASCTNLYNAINDTGDGAAGTVYSTALTANLAALATRATATGVIVRALALSIAGDAVVTTTTGANCAWSAATLTGGGTPDVFQVPTPEEVGVIDVCMINSFVIVIPAQGQGINGRFYFILPAETVIDPLDFATAERAADPVYQCIVFSDYFWLPGQSTTEAWQMTGNGDAPVQRVQGILFSRGTMPGTAVQVKDSLIIVDNDGGVFQITGGGAQRISEPDIEERLRKAKAYADIRAQF